jgi:uncharacterized membrane protein
MELEDEYRDKSDADLKITMLRLVASTPEHRAALRELDRRQHKKDEENQKTQKKIKKIAFWTLLVSLAVLLVTILQLLYVAGTLPYLKKQTTDVRQADKRDTIQTLHQQKEVQSK